jgi:dihydrofolate reductase
MSVFTQFTMSLDGFIAGPNDDIGRLFRWYASGDTEFRAPGVDRSFKISRASAGYLRKVWGKIGAIVTGRRDFDVSRAWGGKSLLGVPMFIVTHRAAHEWVKDGSPFTFVTEGVERAIELARHAAGDKDIAVSGSQIVQQCLRAGLIDEINIDLAPLLLGAGIRLFDHLGPNPIHLEYTRVIEGTGVTHLNFRVLKQESAERETR